MSHGWTDRRASGYLAPTVLRPAVRHGLQQGRGERKRRRRMVNKDALVVVFL
jgi:hypothetical protein